MAYGRKGGGAKKKMTKAGMKGMSKGAGKAMMGMGGMSMAKKKAAKKKKK